MERNKELWKYNDDVFVGAFSDFKGLYGLRFSHLACLNPQAKGTDSWLNDEVSNIFSLFLSGFWSVKFINIFIR